MNFVIPYYTFFTVFTIYTFDFQNVLYVFLPDYILSAIETFLLLLFSISYYRWPEDFSKYKKFLIICIIGIGILSICNFIILTVFWVQTFENTKLYTTRCILFLIQIVLSCLYPIKFPVPPSTPPPYVEYTPI